MAETQYWRAVSPIHITPGAHGTFTVSFQGIVTEPIASTATTVVISSGGTALVVVTSGNLPGTAMTTTFRG